MQKILVVEDEQSLLEMIAFNLELEGYEVRTVANGLKAQELANDLAQFDLVILDVMLPEVSGLDVCRAFRAVSNVPILFLSAKGTTIDRIAGLKLGANDYLPKPFDLEELLLRVRVLVGNNPKRTIVDELTIGKMHINFGAVEVTNLETGQKHELTKRELELLQFFNQHRDEVVSRDELLNSLWKNDQFPTGRTIDNYILNFRKLFESDPKNPIYFHSIRGIGYKFTLPE
jgi:two-component system alkaline phosphatase synthesis response regulator PhoP